MEMVEPPPMKVSKFDQQRALYALAFLVALAIRLGALGSAALNDAEATWAVQALHLARGAHPDIGAQPGLVLMTGALFYVFGSSEFVARLVPAVAGALLVFAPLFFRKPLGKQAGIITAFGLALDPGMVAMSRQADGHMLALGFTLFGLGFLYQKKAAGAGIFLGLALLSGPSLWLGWFTVLITALLYQLFRSNPKEAALVPVDSAAEKPKDRLPFIRDVLLYFAGSLFIAGTLFFLEPKGLSGLAGSLAAFFAGLTGGAETATIPVLVAGWLFYNPLLFILAILASIRAIASKSGIDLVLAAWWLVALMIIVIYPARQVADLVWVNTPMWALAARLVVAAFFQRRPSRLELGQALFTIVVMVSAWLNFLAVIVPQAPDQTGRWLAILFMFLFLGLSIILFTWGWSWQVALRGASLGFLALLVLFTLSTTWRASGISTYPAQEMYRTGPEFDGASLLTETVTNFSEWNTGDPKAIDLSVVDGGSPSVQWLFRDFPNASFVDVISKDAPPSLVVTGEQASLNLPVTYARLPFVKADAPAWNTMDVLEWLDWIVYRGAPLTQTNLDLWVRTNLFSASPEFK